MADTQTKTTSAQDDKARKRASGKQEDDGTTPLPGFDSMQAFRQGALNIEHWISTNQELTRFLSYRLRKNLATVDAFAKCRTSDEFMSTMAKAASDTVHDYANEYDRVLAINLSAAQ